MNRASCRGCIYHKNANSTDSGSEKFCHYMYYTGKQRGCPADKCDKKVVGKTKSRKAFSLR